MARQDLGETYSCENVVDLHHSATVLTSQHREFPPISLRMKGDLEPEIQTINTNFAALAKLWPELPEKTVLGKLMRKDEVGLLSRAAALFSYVSPAGGCA